MIYYFCGYINTVFLPQFLSIFLDNMRNALTLSIAVLVSVTSHAQTVDVTIDDVVMNLYEYMSKEKCWDKRDTLNVLLTIDSVYTCYIQKEDELIDGLNKKYKDIPIHFGLPTKGNSLFVLSFPISTIPYKKYSVVTVGCAGFNIEKKTIRTGGWIEMYFRKKHNKSALKKIKEIGI